MKQKCFCTHCCRRKDRRTDGRTTSCMPPLPVPLISFPLSFKVVCVRSPSIAHGPTNFSSTQRIFLRLWADEKEKKEFHTERRQSFFLQTLQTQEDHEEERGWKKREEKMLSMAYVLCCVHAVSLIRQLQREKKENLSLSLSSFDCNRTFCDSLFSYGF